MHDHPLPGKKLLSAIERFVEKLEMGSAYHGQGVGDALSCRIQESLIVKLEGGLMVAPEEGVLAFARQLPSQPGCSDGD